MEQAIPVEPVGTRQYRKENGKVLELMGELIRVAEVAL